MLSLHGPPRRLYGFRFGWEPVPEAVSLRGGSKDLYLFEPVTGAAIVYDDGWVLIDTGINPELLRDPVLRAEHYTVAAIGCVPEGDPLLRQIEAAGLSLRDLKGCLLSHLHCDHGGGLRHLVDGPPIIIQAREHAFAMEEATLEHSYFRTDYARPGLAWRLIEGEVELAPGLRSVPTFGHTPGHQSFAVDLPVSGTIVLACDAADLRRNIDELIPCGELTQPALAGPDAAERSIELLHRLDRQPRTEVWPGHDPEFWATRRAPPGAYA